jgi:hypothetical protein
LFEKNIFDDLDKIKVTAILSKENSTFQCPHADWVGPGFESKTKEDIVEKYVYKFDGNFCIF